MNEPTKEDLASEFTWLLSAVDFDVNKLDGKSLTRMHEITTILWSTIGTIETQKELAKARKTYEMISGTKIESIPKFKAQNDPPITKRK